MTSDAKPMALELARIVKTFGEVRAVDRISLTVHPGEFLSLLGPSGCGKTTTLRIVAGFETPDEGRVLVAGHDVTSDGPHRRNVNTVFQHYALFPHYSVWDNVAYGLKARHIGRPQIEQRVSDALAMVELGGLEQRRPSQLSGGQQQRVALARALVLKPSVLLLDEPLGALDLRLRQQMQTELKRLQQDVGISFVYVTHDQEEAFAMSDRVALMQAGRIIQLATPQELYDQPVSRYVADFVGESNLLDGIVVTRNGWNVVVDLGVGRVSASTSSSIEAGTPVTVMVRPEHLVLGPTSEQEGELRAVVDRVVFAGPVARMELRLRSGKLIKARRDRAANQLTAEPRPGDECVLAWATEHAIVLTD